MENGPELCATAFNRHPANVMSTLIVNPSLEMSLRFKALLETAGHHPVTLADSARDAESHLRQAAADPEGGFNLVLLEAGLPDGDAEGLCRRIKQEPQFQNTAVVVTAGQYDPGVLQTVFLAGASDYVVLSSDLRELRVRIDAALARIRVIRDLRWSERRLRDITATLGEGLFVIDLEARLDFMNAEAERLLGWYEAELRGRDIAACIRARDRRGDLIAAEQCPIRQSALLGIRYRADEDVFWRKDGSPLMVAYGVNPLLEEGRLVGSVTVFHDLTEQRRHETERFLAAKAIEFSPEGIVVTASAPPHAILKINPAFTAITGYTTEEMRGQSAYSLFNWRDDPHFYQHMLEELRSQGEWQGEIWTQRKSGTAYLAWLRIAAIRDANGRMTQYMAIFSDITTRKEAEKRLEYQATHDPLTTLPNRAYFTTQLERATDHARLLGQRVAVLFVDLDRFKPVNDRFGHAVGDRLLCVVAKRLLNCIRSSDIVARLGGDEFVIALTGMKGIAGARRVAEKVLENLARPFLIHDQEILISASVGISLFPDDTGDVAELVHYADQALYRAKENGRNDYRFHRECAFDADDEPAEDGA